MKNRILLVIPITICFMIPLLKSSTAADRVLFNSGPELVAYMLSLRPEREIDQEGSLTIVQKNNRLTIPIRYRLVLTPTNWISIYMARLSSNSTIVLRVTFRNPAPPTYAIEKIHNGNHTVEEVTDYTNVWKPFCESDFYIGDLGLDFLYWPNQKLIKREMRRSRYCYVLESTPRQDLQTPYAKVISWIDTETFGIVRAEARDSHNKLLKEFEPKEFKKVQGTWHVTELQIRQIPRGSRTKIELAPTTPN